MSAPGAAGAASGTGPDQQSLHAQAAQIASQVAADNRTLDELDASFDAATLRYQQVQDQAAGLQRAMATSEAALSRARAELRLQLVMAYVAGGPAAVYTPGPNGSDPSLVLGYASVISGGRRQMVQQYRQGLVAEGRAAAAVAANQEQAAAALAAISQTRRAAAAALADRQAALAAVKGQLAVLVANVQRASQAAEQQQVVAHLQASGQTPPPAPVTPPAAALPSATAPLPSGPAPYPPQTAPVPAEPGSPVTTQATTTTSATTTTTTAGSTTTTTVVQGGPPPPQAPGASAALAYARAQLGKPYQWGGSGPGSFDCSGLVMMAWGQAGISFPHLAQDQYDQTAREPLSDLLPGDLVFFGTPSDVYHVGIYIGGGDMIDAPETGQNVSIQPIYWDNLLGAGRVTTSS